MAHHILVYQLRVLLRVLQHVRTRAHDAHVAQQHVDELRQLVDVRLAHDVAPLRLPRVVLRCLQRVRLRVHLHAAELQAVELLSVQAVALLTEEDRTRHSDFRDDAHDDQDWDEQRAEEAQREDDVESALQHPVLYPAQRLLVQGQAGHAAHHAEVHLVVEVVVHVRHAVEPDDVVLAVFDDRKDLVLHPRRQAAVEAPHRLTVLLQVGDHVLRRAEVGTLLREVLVGHRVEISAHAVADRRVAGQLVVQRHVVLRAAHEHHAVPVAYPLPVLHQQPTHRQAEAADRREHRHEVFWRQRPITSKEP